MNLLLIDETLKSLETFIQGCNETTKYVIYGLEDSFEELKLKIQNLEVSSFNNVGFVFEDGGITKTFIYNTPFISLDESNINENLTTQFIKELVESYNVKTLDFLACDLLLNPVWKSYFEYLQVENSTLEKNLIVRASNNKSGNLQHGGDWILESTNEDIAALYFNENIGQWSHLLGEYVGNHSLNVILSNELTNNVYVSGSSSNITLTKRGYQLFSIPSLSSILIEDIIPTVLGSSFFDSYYIITNESSNNLYAIGVKCLGFNQNTYISGNIPLTRISTNILNKKVIKVNVNYFGKTGLYVITNESVNNLYTAGDYDIIGTNVPSGNYGANYTLKQILNNKKVITCSIGNTNAGILTDETINNLYTTGDGSRRFTRFTTLNKKFIDIKYGYQARFYLTDDSINNLYGSGYLYSINKITTSSSTNAILGISNKKITKIELLTTGVNQRPRGIIALTDEGSNNLYYRGAFNYPVNSSSESEFINVTENILNKKVNDIIFCGDSFSIITNEESNNLYACGKPNSASNYRGFTNMGLSLMETYPSITSVSLSKESNILYNKTIYKLFGNFNDTIINDGSSFYISNKRMLINDDNYYKKWDIDTNKKIIKSITGNYFWVGITNESSNNFYAIMNHTNFNANVLNKSTLSNFQNINQINTDTLLNKYISNVSLTDNMCYIITNENSNNLYGISRTTTPLGNTRIINGTETPLNPNNGRFVNIYTNIQNLKIIEVSCSNNHVGIITNESSNNLYLLGTNTNGQLNINSTNASSKLIKFTKSFNNILNKKRRGEITSHSPYS